MSTSTTRMREWRKKNPTRAQQAARRGRCALYGLTEEDYNSRLQQQGGVCRICGNSEPIVGRRLAIDHDHTSGRVRGLLCSSCNTGLGKFRDDPRLLLQAFYYLEF